MTTVRALALARVLRTVMPAPRSPFPEMEQRSKIATARDGGALVR